MDSQLNVFLIMLITPITALKAFFLNVIGDLKKSLGNNVLCRGG
jgi:hypothetical protein